MRVCNVDQDVNQQATAKRFIKTVSHDYNIGENCSETEVENTICAEVHEIGLESIAQRKLCTQLVLQQSISPRFFCAKY